MKKRDTNPYRGITNADLARSIRVGIGPREGITIRGVIGEYLRRLQRKMGERCENGHGACALMVDGPCSYVLDPRLRA